MQPRVESSYGCKPKADRMLPAVLFFGGGSLVMAYAALSTASGLYAGFLWCVALVAFSYAVAPVWCLSRDQHITITSTAIRMPRSPFSSSSVEVPFSAIFYWRSDQHQCWFVADLPGSRRTFFIKRSLLPAQDAFDQICRVLNEKAPNKAAPAV